MPCDRSAASPCDTVGVKLSFDVNKLVFKNSNISTLVGNFSGIDLNTVIKGECLLGFTCQKANI